MTGLKMRIIGDRIEVTGRRPEPTRVEPIVVGPRPEPTRVELTPELLKQIRSRRIPEMPTERATRDMLDRWHGGGK